MPDRIASSGAVIERRVFLSYGRDEHVALARRIRDDLQARGHGVWFDETRLRPGSDWEASIEEGLEWVAERPGAGWLVLLMTPHSVRRPGGFCLNELARALHLNLALIPVMVVTCVPPLSIYRAQWLDMTSCEPVEERTERYERQFRALLDALELGRVPAADDLDLRLTRLLRPLAFDAEIHAHVARFRGRSGLIARIRTWLADSAAPKVLWITGPPGVGKSALASQLVHRDAIAAFHMCRAGNTDKASPRRCVLSLAEQLSRQVREYREQLEALGHAELDEIVRDLDAATLFDRLVAQPLARGAQARSETAAILVDAIDEAAHGATNELAVLVRTAFLRTPPWLRIILTSRPDPDLVRELGGVPLLRMEIDPTAEENLADLRAFVTSELQHIAPGYAASQAVDAICDRSEGLFQYAEVALKLIASDPRGLDRVEDLPDGMRAVYADWFRHRFPANPPSGRAASPSAKTFDALCRPVLQVVAAGREPLGRRAIADVLEWDTARITSAEEALGSLFRMDETGLRPAHSTLMEWLCDRWAAGETYFVDVASGHARLASYCANELARGTDRMSGYARVHAGTHFAESGRWDELARALERPDLDFESLWFDRGHLHDAMRCLTGMLGNLPESRRGSVFEARLAVQLARVHGRRAEYRDAERWLLQAIGHAAGKETKRIRAIAYHELGSLAFYRGDMAAAASAFLRAYRLSASGAPRHGDEVAANLVALATLAMAARRYRRAEEIANRALAEAGAAGDLRHCVAARRILTNLCKDDARYDEAAAHLAATDLLVGIGGMVAERPVVEITRGWLAYNRAVLDCGPHADAKAAFDRALKGALAVGSEHHALEARLGLVACALATGETETAARLLADARARDCRIEHRNLATMDLLAAAGVLQQRGRWAAATSAYDEARSLAQRSEANAWEASALVGKGCVHWHYQEFVEAEACWHRAREVAATMLSVRRRLVDCGIERGRLDPRATPL